MLKNVLKVKILESNEHSQNKPNQCSVYQTAQILR